MEEGGVWQLRMGRRKLVDGAICGRRGSMATQNGAQKVGRRSLGLPIDRSQVPTPSPTLANLVNPL